EMERRSPGEKQANTNRSVAATIPTTSAAVTMATGSSGSTTCTQAPPASLSIIPSDRQAVQVIQHAIHRPQSMAAQYLHRMYAAQQQHLMLQTAALQQQQQAPHLQSLATIQQASVCQRRSPSSSTGSLVQPAGVSQNSITLPASPVTAQLIGRTQPTNSTAAATTISQQAMLLGNRPANCNQAQMYLRTQMLILTPAAPVAAVQSDLPAVTSCSSLPTSSQVQNLALHTHLPGALATAHSVILKPSAQPQALSSGTSLSKMSICALKANQLSDTSNESSQPGSERVFLPHIFLFAILPAAYSPLQAHALVKQQLSCPSGQRVAHHQLILQQATAGALNHRQLQPIALRVAPQEPNSNPLPLSVKKQTTSNTLSQTNGDPQTPSTSSSSQSLQNQPPPPPPPLVLPRLPQKPPASLQRLSVHSVQALAVQSGQMLLTEQELPVAEALVQMPYQNLPPPQTVAVDLKVHPVRRNENPSVSNRDLSAGLLFSMCTGLIKVFFWVPFQSGQTCKVKKDEKEDECSPSRKRDRTPTAVIVSPKQNGAGKVFTLLLRSSSPIMSSHSVISNPPPPPVSLPPPILPTAVRGPSQPPSAPARLPGSPDRILTTHVLTHLIEGFVIREGLEPFPVRPLEIQQTRRWRTMALRQMVRPVCMWGCKCVCGCVTNSWSREVAEWGESVASVLQCEYCGSRGYAQTFLRSKRFCSMSCVRSVSCTKRITMLRAGRWGHRPMGRRGRPPSRVNGASREHFLRQVKDDEEVQEEDEEEEDEPPVPMKTRLRKQAERAQEREREKEREKRMPETIDVSDEGEDAGCPSQWNVEQVFSYISSLPGGQDVAEEFRSQEIDGQALLLLTEDHLVSTMNVKLGPALKICAHINSLKD
uniref:Polyhomeotic homolog 3 n=1 Tax=Echeneis naucrates TaxID=173247 RepID=A0A665X6I0_ECHNA